MTQDMIDNIAEQICRLWTTCGGYGPPHAFKVTWWGRGTAQIQKEHTLTEDQWCEAHQRAVTMGATRGRGTV